LRRAEHCRIANRRSVGVARSLELHAPHLVRGAFVCAEIAPPFGEDDAALALDRGIFEEGASCPVFEHGQRPVEDAWTIGRHTQ